jgi:high-affinity nickel permease
VSCSDAVALGLVKWIVDGVVMTAALRSIGGLVGTLVSGGFLVLIGIQTGHPARHRPRTGACRAAE